MKYESHENLTIYFVYKTLRMNATQKSKETKSCITLFSGEGDLKIAKKYKA